MGREKFFKELGISPRTDDLKNARIEVIERETTPDSSQAKVKVVKPDDDHEPGSTKLEETVAEEDVKQEVFQISNLCTNGIAKNQKKPHVSDEVQVPTV